MRRKPISQGSGGYNNQSRKPRYQGGGSGGGDYRSQGQGNNRPRKNYTALREKYLAQARDALASGDRVLAENYFQHADHCYRMMVEEGYSIRNNYTPPAQATEGGQNGEAQETAANESISHEDMNPANVNQLPAFITTNFDQPELPKPPETAVVQNWEERDA